MARPATDDHLAIATSPAAVNHRGPAVGPWTASVSHCGVPRTQLLPSSRGRGRGRPDWGRRWAQVPAPEGHEAFYSLVFTLPGSRKDCRGLKRIHQDIVNRSRSESKCWRGSGAGSVAYMKPHLESPTPGLQAATNLPPGWAVLLTLLPLGTNCLGEL